MRRKREWLRNHGAIGIVKPEEVPVLTQATRRVLILMKDLCWHSADEIRLAAGSEGLPASEGLRRMRDLRPYLAYRGYVINKRRISGTRHFEYRIEIYTSVVSS